MKRCDGQLGNGCGVQSLKEGHLQCHQLGLEFPLLSRDLVMMRSRLLTRAVGPFTEGKRYSTVLFGHDGIIKEHSEVMEELEARSHI